jgi:hypothetical protein
MSFFQTLFNSYKPYLIEKNHPDDYRTSFIYSSYNSCYPIVDNTRNTTTGFRKKASAEAMLFLLAYGITYVVQEKNYGEFEYKGFIYGVSKLLSKAIVKEVKDYGVDEKFIEDRIFNYATLLDENNDSSMIHVLINMNEKPLNHLIKSCDDFPNVSIDSNLARNLGEILLLSPFLTQAIDLMKQAMNKTYGLL